MLAAISFCPSPPLLVPELAAGAAGELAGLRAACAEAVRRLLATGPDEVVVLGPGPVTSWYAPGTAGGLHGYGVPLVVRLPGPPPPDATRGPGGPGGSAGAARGSGAAAGSAGGPGGSGGSAGAAGGPGGSGGGLAGPAGGLPLALAVGAWLLGEAGARVPGRGLAVAPDADPAGAAAGLAGPGRRALLVMGDGSARRSEAAPGYVDPRAAGFDAAVAVALRTADAAALRNLDPVLGADLLAAGVPAWRTAGHAATPAPGRPGPAGHPGAGAWRAELLHDEAPYGVGYLVAAWT